MEQLRSNKRLELARGFILYSRANIFLTGKAGTGKTTLLRSVVQELGKRAVIAAPTGVAALNAGGVTLHSLFALSFAPFLPSRSRQAAPRRLSKNRISLIRSIELLIIDEVSMVRADVMDAIDHTLRLVRRSTKPFAGVQLLVIGDIQQLSPICRDEEWEMLKEYYPSPYFFDSQALRKTPYITIELDEIFRQRDSRFTDLLNAVRDNSMNREMFELLNSRYIPDFEPSNEDDYITLTTHNHTANMINSTKLAALKSRSHSFEAKISGDFSESAYPNDETLELKVGAQVLFIKNDISPQKRYYNGLLGHITEIDNKGGVTVQPKSGGEPIRVERDQWESLDYQINAEGEMEQSIKGTFTQVPLKCAWAITIHKSQGLSFDRAIIDASSSFAHGQVYVALSRCRTLEGMVLRRPIGATAIVEDHLVEGFCDYVANNQPTEEQLQQHKRECYAMTLCEIFDFESLQRLLWDLMSELSGATAKRYPKVMSALMELLNIFDRDIVKVGVSFQVQLRRAIFDDDSYAQSNFIEGRLRQAAGYFTPRFEALESIVGYLREISVDSQEKRKRLGGLISQLSQMSAGISFALKMCGEGFFMERYISERAKIISMESMRDGQVQRRRGATGATRATGATGSDGSDGSEEVEIQHPKLLETLFEWRKEEAKDMGKPAFCVLTNRTLEAITRELPLKEMELKRVIGMGNVKMERYASQILDIVSEYCFNEGVDKKSR